MKEEGSEKGRRRRREDKLRKSRAEKKERREERAKERRDQEGIKKEEREAEEGGGEPIEKDVTGWTEVTMNRKRKMVQIFVKVDGGKTSVMEMEMSDKVG